jgi:hypothetical protein
MANLSSRGGVTYIIQQCTFLGFPTNYLPSLNQQQHNLAGSESLVIIIQRINNRYHYISFLKFVVLQLVKYTFENAYFEEGFRCYKVFTFTDDNLEFLFRKWVELEYQNQLDTSFPQKYDCKDGG